MAESVDARGLNPRVGQTACGFESHFGHQLESICDEFDTTHRPILVSLRAERRSVTSACRF